MVLGSSSYWRNIRVFCGSCILRRPKWLSSLPPPAIRLTLHSFWLLFGPSQTFTHAESCVRKTRLCGCRTRWYQTGGFRVQGSVIGRHWTDWSEWPLNDIVCSELEAEVTTRSEKLFGGHLAEVHYLLEDHRPVCGTSLHWVLDSQVHREPPWEPNSCMNKWRPVQWLHLTTTVSESILKMFL